MNAKVILSWKEVEILTINHHHLVTQVLHGEEEGEGGDGDEEAVGHDGGEDVAATLPSEGEGDGEEAAFYCPLFESHLQ